MANLLLDRRLRRAILNDREIMLSEPEFDILWILSAFTGQPLSLKSLTSRLDDLDHDLDINQVMPALRSLEAKLPHNCLSFQSEGRVLLA